MKQESMKVLFFIRKSRLKKNGEAPIFLRVTINGQLDEVRIQRSVPLKLWDNMKERSKGKDRSSTELNSYIEALKVRLYQIHKELLCREALITPKNLLIKLFSKEERHLVLQTMRKCIDDWISLIGTEYQPSTISRYNNCYESLQTVIKDFYRKEDITFHELNGEFIDRFEMHLRTVRKLSQNTLTKYMSCFRKFLGLAREKRMAGAGSVGRKTQASVPERGDVSYVPDLGGTETDYGEGLFHDTSEHREGFFPVLLSDRPVVY